MEPVQVLRMAPHHAWPSPESAHLPLYEAYPAHIPLSEARMPVVTGVEIGPPVVTAVGRADGERRGVQWPPSQEPVPLSEVSGSLQQMSRSCIVEVGAGRPLSQELTRSEHSGSSTQLLEMSRKPTSLTSLYPVVGPMSTRFRTSTERLPAVVTAVETAPAVVTAITTLPLQLSPRRIGNGSCGGLGLLANPLPPSAPASPPPSPPEHPLLPPMNFEFRKDWSPFKQCSPVASPSVQPPLPEPPLSGRGAATQEAYPAMQAQLQRLLESQEALKDDLRKVREQVTQNYGHLERFRTNLEVSRQASAVATPRSHHPAAVASPRCAAAPPSVAAAGGVQVRTLDGGPQSSRGGRGPTAGQLRAAAAGRASGGSRHPLQGGDCACVDTCGDDANDGPCGVNDVAPNLGYGTHAEVISSLSSGLKHHVGRVHQSIPGIAERAKVCCWT